jgi:uncharacterized membrane protein
MTVIICLIIVILSIIFKLFPPKNINDFYGYRTLKSKKNIKNWQIANTTFTLFFLCFSIFNLIISLINNFIFKYDFSICLLVLSATELITIIIIIENKIK